MKLSRERFADLVSSITTEVMNSLPDDLRAKAGEIVFRAMDRPGKEHQEISGGDDDLLGLYEGVPLPERSMDQDYTGPERITLFRIHLQDMCRSEKELREEIRITVVHELGHFFGFDEDELEKMGVG